MRAAATLPAGLALALAGCGTAAAPPAANQAAAANQASARSQVEPAAPASPSDLPELSGRIVDRANLLSPAEETGLTALLAALEQRTGDQLVIATTTSLGGRAIEDYGRTLGNSWGIGQSGRDNGVLIIVAPTERKTRIAVGYGLEAILTDARAKAIIERDMLPHFREAHWYQGVEAGTQAIIAILVAHEREPRRRRT